jgi:hypothetical protein
MHDLGTSLQLAVREIFPSKRTDRAVQSKAREMGNRPDIIAVISAVFRQGDFDVNEVIDAHIRLIKSSNPKIAIKALREYWRIVLPHFGQ